MQPTLCSRCKKNVAVIFITRLEGGQTKNEGLCLKCARQLGIKPLDQMMEQMGLNDDTIDMLSSEINSLEDLGALMPAGPDVEDEDMSDEEAMADAADEDAEDGEDAQPPAFPFPFLRTEKKNDASSDKKDKDKKKKRKYLDTYCDDLTRKAREGRLDRIIGREQETDRIPVPLPAHREEK